MKSKALLLASLLLSAGPLTAKEITITLNDDEQKAAIQLLDQAVRAGGLQSAEAALVLARKIAQAVQQPLPASASAPSEAK